LHCCVGAYRRGDVLGVTELEGVGQKVDHDLLDSILVAVDDLVLYIVRLENDFNISLLTFELQSRHDLCDGVHDVEFGKRSPESLLFDHSQVYQVIHST